MTNQSSTQEPTMEEILASIRRIISEDSGGKDEAETVAAPQQIAETEPEFEAELEDYEEAAPHSDPEPEYAPEPAVVASEVEDNDVVFSEEDVLDLTEPLEMEPEPEPAPIPQRHEPVAFAAAHEEFEPEPEIAFEEPEMTAPASYQSENSAPLLSRDAENAASAAFGALASSMLTSSGSTRTLEDIVSDMLRPMLKQWLDQNLPSVVEELVREEIERVARRAR